MASAYLVKELYDDAMHAMFNAGSSKHFVHSSGWYESDTELFLTMEYLPHGDLEGYLKRLNGVPVPEDEVKTILRQVLGCLETLHSQSYAHRDIKPAVCFFPSSSAFAPSKGRSHGKERRCSGIASL